MAKKFHLCPPHFFSPGHANDTPGLKFRVKVGVMVEDLEHRRDPLVGGCKLNLLEFKWLIN